MSELTIGDVRLIEQIIRACTMRGAFQAEELLSVGTIYEKLNKILKSHTIPPQESAVPTPVPPTLPAPQTASNHLYNLSAHNPTTYSPTYNPNYNKMFGIPEEKTN